jgi:hypothetical protein
VSRSLAPALLLSMPQMADPNFARTVILLCKHNDDGAFGLVVNRPLVTTGRVIVNSDPPVETERARSVGRRSGRAAEQLGCCWRSRTGDRPRRHAHLRWAIFVTSPTG